MLTELCQELKNWFVKSENDKHIGIITIENGSISSPSIILNDKQYYRVIGSLYNDGVHQYNNEEDTLIDEEFDGAIWLMYVPNQIIELDEKISKWNTENQKIQLNPYKSESFGGYSYTLKSGKNSDTISWQDIFSSELNKWRKIR